MNQEKMKVICFALNDFCNRYRYCENAPQIKRAKAVAKEILAELEPKIHPPETPVLESVQFMDEG